MKLTPQQAALLLTQIPKWGPRTIKKAIDRSGSAVKVLELNRNKLQLIKHLTKEQYAHFNQWPKGLAAMESEEQFQKKNGLTTLVYGEPNYPKSLSFIADPPSILFQKGKVNWQNPRLLSIVGTRQPTAAGVAFCQQLVEELAPFQPIIIIGFARGIDIIAHRQALTKGLETVAVLGHAFGQWYPREHEKYVNEICQNGCFLSEYASTAPFEPSNFLRRNRIIAGLAHATIVIESGEKGGSLVTATQALDYGREIFAVPGRITDKKSQGCLQLIKSDRARMITAASDIIEWLEWEEQSTPRSVQKQLFASMDPEEEAVYSALEEK